MEVFYEILQETVRNKSKHTTKLQKKSFKVQKYFCNVILKKHSARIQSRFTSFPQLSV